MIRNFLLIDDSNQDYLFEEYWLYIENEIGYDEIEEFLIYFLNSITTSSITKNNAYEKFKLYYYKNFNDHEEMFKKLKKYSKYYSAFIGKNSNYSKDIEYLLSSFRILKQMTIYSFLFKIFEDYENNVLTEQNIIEILIFKKL